MGKPKGIGKQWVCPVVMQGMKMVTREHLTGVLKYQVIKTPAGRDHGFMVVDMSQSCCYFYDTRVCDCFHRSQATRIAKVLNASEDYPIVPKEEPDEH
jgi:hypothetical protein